MTLKIFRVFFSKITMRWHPFIINKCTLAFGAGGELLKFINLKGRVDSLSKVNAVGAIPTFYEVLKSFIEFKFWRFKLRDSIPHDEHFQFIDRLSFIDKTPQMQWMVIGNWFETICCIL